MANQFRDTTKKVFSPAAQAVLDAFLGDAEDTGLQMDDLRENVAAALRAAADQVVPVCSTKSDRGIQRMMIRNDLLIIAAELEGSNG
jgi:hypothetical protein